MEEFSSSNSERSSGRKSPIRSANDVPPVGAIVRGWGMGSALPKSVGRVAAPSEEMGAAGGG